MTRRGPESTLLIRDADFILTLDSRRRILTRHSLLVEGGRIAEAGPTQALDAKHLSRARERGRVIEACGRLVLRPPIRICVDLAGLNVHLLLVPFSSEYRL